MYYFLSLLFLFFSSCATKPLKLETGLSASDFWQDQEVRRQTFTMMDGKAKIRLEEKGKSVSGNGRILVHSPQSIKMEIRDLFGRLHFSLLKKDNSFTAHFPQQKLAFQEEEGGKLYLSQNIRVPLAFDQVLNLLLGLLPDRTSPVSFKSWNWDAKEGHYVGVLETKNGEIECQVDGDLAVLKKLIWRKPAPAFQVVYEDFGACCNGKKNAEKIDLAYSAKLEVLRGEEKLEMEWEELALSAKLPRTFDIELPKETEKVLLKP